MEDVLIFVQSTFYRLQLRYVDVAVVQEFNKRIYKDICAFE